MLQGKKRVLLVDRHPVFRHGLVDLLNQQPDLIACGEADNMHSSLDMIPTLQPDLCVTDLLLKQSTGFALLRAVKVRRQVVPILVLSTHEECLYCEEALRAGARGFVMKEEAPAEILTAIRRVLSGRIYLSQSMGTKLLAPMVNGGVDMTHSPVERLSNRELEVFRLLGQGRETRQIAESLHVSVKTVETYREHIKLKLNLDNSTQLIRRAVEWLQRGERENAESWGTSRA